MKYDELFRKFKLKLSHIRSLIEELQAICRFKIILNEKINGVKVEGVVVSSDIIQFLDKHEHIVDCIHIDLAKSHELCFVTAENKIGKIKALYKDIVTENKLMKQYT